MCGIAGICSNNHNINSLWIKKMTDAIRHRGPDDEGYFFYALNESKYYLAGGNDTPKEVYKADLPYAPKQHIHDVKGNFNVILGHRRLSIIDPSPSGHQPLSSDDGKIWIIFNGEIYNYIELRDELKDKGYVFKTSCDTEVIIKAYEAWGIECLNRFNGMWSFVILDLRKKILFGARDRFGVKPFYYYKKDEVFLFASEIKAILTLPYISRRSNQDALIDYFFLNKDELQEETFFKGVFELKPSHFFIFDLVTCSLQIKRYYELKTTLKWESFNEYRCRKYLEDIRELIFKAVSIRLRSDVPIGSCLSGGIDSSSIVCVINELLKKENIPVIGDKQKVFTASYKEFDLDESKWAKKVVEKTKTDWHRVYPTFEEFIGDLDDVIYTQDMPFLSTSIYAQYRVIKLAKERGVKVLLDGQGGDELFTGYLGYYKTFFADILMNFDFKSFLRELKNLDNSPTNFKNVFQGTIKVFLNNLFSHKASTCIGLKNNIKLNFLHKGLKDAIFSRFSQKYKWEYLNLNEMLKSYITGLNLKPLLRYEDRNSMRFSIESRTPFADDINLIEYVFKVPSSYKIYKGWSKYLLRDAMKDVLPNEIRNRVDKIGFTTPEAVWLKQNKEFIKKIFLDSKDDDFLDLKAFRNNFDTKFDMLVNTDSTFFWKSVNYLLWKKIFRIEN